MMDKKKRGAGAPKKLQDGKRTTIYTSSETVERAIRIGSGNFSEGLRIATDFTSRMPDNLRNGLQQLINDENVEALNKTSDFVEKQRKGIDS